MSIHRRAGLLQRPVEQRNAWLCLVASEDTYVCKQYFEALQANGVVDARRVHVVVFPTLDTKSSPRAVLDLLLEIKVNLKPMDQQWLSLDRDRWPEKQLADVCREVRQKGWFMAVSNPCFEAWLLLHLNDDPIPTSGRGCEVALRSALGGSYNKANLRPEPWTPSAVRTACARARARDLTPDHRWPQTPGSHLYRLVERLLPQTPAE